MIENIQILVLPEVAHTDELLVRAIKQEVEFSESDTINYHVRKRSIDARKSPAKYLLTIDVYINEEVPVFVPQFDFKDVKSSKKSIVIIGRRTRWNVCSAGSIRARCKTCCIRTWKSVKDRRLDLAKISKEHIVNPESNYCFGEGGAGTYSDGKLYTRSKKKGSVRKILEQLVFFGADQDILVEAHPHIGTNKLPKIIESIRELIIEKGGEFHFNSKLTDIVIEDNEIKGCVINDTDTVDCSELILATGHSARDIYYLLEAKGVELEYKQFALGVRVEHSQELIDQIQYKQKSRGEFLPPAAYSLVQKVGDRGVYSFCMCPGGVIAPCATEEGEVVTNGWSPSKRNNPYSNSGIVTEVRWDDIPEFHKFGALAGLEFQKSVEKSCWEAAGKTQKVPAQRLLDFVKNRESKDLPKTSYFPGLTSVNLNEVLPKFIADNLREGFKGFENKMRGYLTNDAVIHGTESRTSSPVRIPRDRVTMQHTQIKGLYPCAEGAGFAGGIVSAAIDGQNCVIAHLASN